MTGLERIAAERKHQIDDRGFDAAHDARHDVGTLAIAAALLAAPDRLFALHTTENDIAFVDCWPFEDYDPRPHDTGMLLANNVVSRNNRLEQLTIAGALIAAEIDAIQAFSSEQYDKARLLEEIPEIAEQLDENQDADQ